MATGREPVDLGFAEFAAQLMAELHEALLVAQDEQEARRAKLAEMAAVPPEEFARRWVTQEHVETELVRLFPGRQSAAHRIRAGLTYQAALGKRAETPAIQTKLGLRLTPRDVRVRGKVAELAPHGVKVIREAVRLRLAEARLKTLRRAASEGLPRLVVDSGRVNVKLSFRLADLGKAAARLPKKGLLVPLASLTGTGDPGAQRARYRLVVRQVNEQTMPVPPTEGSGIGELDLSFKTI